VDRNDSATAYSGTITAAGLTFTVNQPALVCTYALSSSSISLPAAHSSGQISVTTAEGCPWTANGSGSFIGFDTPYEHRGPLTIDYHVNTNYAADRVATTLIAGQ